MESLLHQLDSIALELLPAFIVLYFIFGIDDLWLDWIAWTQKIHPVELTESQIQSFHCIPEKKIAILIASWKEAGVLMKMIQGNRAQIRYSNYDFFLGVYPNDPETRHEAEALSHLFPNVHVVVNPVGGPTSKGQLLNELVGHACRMEPAHTEIFLIHDSEDLIHPLSLKVINWEIEKADFVQIPVFSLPLKFRSLVGGTYVDEFGEFHTKDILVREKLGAPVPSAGVGTALSRRLVLRFLKAQNGILLNPKSLTEDYELGLTAPSHGFKTRFAAYFRKESTGKRDFIATREYFPKSLLHSIRQKTRWTLGIVFQGTEHFGWKGNLIQKYFLYRDRKGLVANVVVILGSTHFIYFLLRDTLGVAPLFDGKPFLLFAAISNLFFMLNRFFQRAVASTRLYGYAPLLLLPLRIPLTNLINAVASIRATTQFLHSKLSGVSPGWVKTEHELPEEFGS